MSDLITRSKKAPKESKDGPSSAETRDTTDHEDTLPDVTATSKSAETPTPATPGPGAPTTSAPPRITMKDIKLMMAQTAADITKDLTTKHEREMTVQLDAVKAIEKKFNELKKETRTSDQASPFETPRAARPQDLAYQQILTTSKTAKVKETTTTVPTLPTTTTPESVTDKTLAALVKLMSTTIKNTDSKETTTDL